MTVYVLVPYDNLDISQLPAPTGGRPGQLPSHGGGHPDQGLPSGGWRPTDPGFGQGGGRPDNSLPGSGGRPDNSLPGGGLHPSQLPSHGGWGGRPDNSLPGIDKPVDPGYGTDPRPPGSPDQGLPMPSPAKPFTDEEKQQILHLAEQKFIHTELSPMRCIVQAARWVLVTRKQDGGASGGRPDNTLPGQPGSPDNSLPGQRPPHVSGQPIPGQPARPDQGLPPTSPGTPAAPDQGLPPTTPPTTATPKSY